MQKPEAGSPRPEAAAGLEAGPDRKPDQTRSRPRLEAGPHRKTDQTGIWTGPEAGPDWKPDCCNSIVAAVMLQQYAVVLLQQYFCKSTVARVLLQQY